MKRLITLIFSAALLCPMWAGAQTTSIPSINGQLHYVGSLVVSYNSASLLLLSPTSFLNNAITDLRLNIQTPNSASPIKFVSGYFNTLSGWSTFYGTLVAINNSNYPNTTNATTSGYAGVFALGLTQMGCNFSSDLSSASCQLFYTQSVTAQSYTSGIIGQATFTHTTAP